VTEVSPQYESHLSTDPSQT